MRAEGGARSGKDAGRGGGGAAAGGVGDGSLPGGA